jgi:hypothetical protein
VNLAEAHSILTLTADQLFVRRAATTLRSATRDRYMPIIAAELSEVERIDDATVQSTVDLVLATIVNR